MPSIKVLTIEVLPDMLDAERHIREVDTANTLDDMCKWIFNGLPYNGQIDYTEVNVNGIHYDVWCDDSAFDRRPVIPTLFISEEEILVGSLLIAKVDENGDTCGLNELDVKRLEHYLDEREKELYEFMERNFRH